MKRTVLLLVLTFIGSNAAEKQRDWQTGTVTNMEERSEVSGFIKTSDYSSIATHRDYEMFSISGPDYEYVARQPLKWRWSKPANLTVNGPVKFAVERRKVFLIDEDGKEHEMEIVKRILKQRAGP